MSYWPCTCKTPCRTHVDASFPVPHLQGMAMVELLRQLERRAGAPIWTLFDVIGGTSTGGLLAVCLGLLRLNLDACQEIYTSLGNKVRCRIAVSACTCHLGVCAVCWVIVKLPLLLGIGCLPSSTLGVLIHVTAVCTLHLVMTGCCGCCTVCPAGVQPEHCCAGGRRLARQPVPHVHHQQRQHARGCLRQQA